MRADVVHRTIASMRYGLLILFSSLALLNLLVMVQANQLGLAQARQPYDFYVLLHASAQLFRDPSLVYQHQAPGTFGPYWSPWLWNGASYLYAPWFAVVLAPLAAVHPPFAKLVWAGVSYVLLVVASALTIRRVASATSRVFVMLLIFIMPVQIFYTNQSLPAYWLHPQRAGMWISPVFFADYYWGNTNTMILALGLLAYCFALGSRSWSIGSVRIQSYVVSALLVALDTFKIMALPFIIPFWLLMNRGRMWRAAGLFILFTLALNGLVISEPSLLAAYASMIASQSATAKRSPLWQVYEYVWYYTLPIVGMVLLRQQDDMQRRGTT